MSFNLSHLNSSQKEAVLTTDGPLLLLAGAGSGKTTVLMNRIAYLLENGVEPREIIAITFTNKAAGEMKERLEKMGIPGSQYVWASTFHSACVRILRQDIDRLGYDKAFTIYDTADTVALVKKILKDNDIDDKNFPPKTVLTYISNAKGDMVSGEEFVEKAEKSFDPRPKIIGNIFVEYEKRMKGANALDFDDLILLTVKLFQTNPDVLEIYKRRFKYVLVDEYQDTNKLQYLLTKALASGHGNICVVGDDDQSIYKFRGATIENILTFEKQYKNARVIRLEQNYRSTGAILKAANDVIHNNKGRKGKELWTENPTGDLPLLRVVSDEREEARYVAEQILESVTQGRKWQDHALLYRMNAQSNQFETEFKRNNIPYRIYGGTGFYDRAEIKDMLAYLCVLHNPTDDIRLLRIINNPARGLGDTSIGRLALIAEENGISIFEAIKICHEYENMKSAVPKLKQFASMIDGLRELVDVIPLDALYDELLDRTGYIRMLEDKKQDENLSRIENVRELKTNIIAFINEYGGTLFDFLSETALFTDLDRDDMSTDRVTMMTMHSAKGLEFDTVFLVGAEEGIFPGTRAIGEADEMEEERRLCYVAMTRAERKLFFTSAQRRMIFGKTMSSQPSRFAYEIKSDNLEISESQNSFRTSNSWNNSFESDSDFYDDFSTFKSSNTHSSRPNQTYPSRYAPKPKKAPIIREVKPTVKFASGDELEHTAFGHGTVKSVTPAGGDALLEIEFKEQGTKRLMLNSASRYLKKI